MALFSTFVIHNI